MNSRTVSTLVVALAIAILQLARPLLPAAEQALQATKQPVNFRAGSLAKSLSPAKASVRTSPAHECGAECPAMFLLPFAPRTVVAFVAISDPLPHEFRATAVHRDRSPPVCA